jgi:hypothetical protein
MKAKKRKPLSIGKLLGCAEVLQEWQRCLAACLDAACPGEWDRASLLDLSDADRNRVRTLGLIRALQVELLDEIEMFCLVRRALKKQKRKGKP